MQCKDEKPIKIHDLRNTKTVSPSYVNKSATKLKPQSFCLTVRQAQSLQYVPVQFTNLALASANQNTQTIEDEEIEIEGYSQANMAEWAVAIDGLCMPNYSTHLNAQFRVRRTPPFRPSAWLDNRES
jgi:hypothetical protein